MWNLEKTEAFVARMLPVAVFFVVLALIAISMTTDHAAVQSAFTK